MRYRLILCPLLILLLLAVPALPALGATYTDTPGHWAEQAIETWSGHQVIQGANGLFRPDDGITRGEMALILDRIMLYDQKADNTFLDLTDTWYTEAVLKLNAAGVMLGYDNLLRPLDGITRQEAALMIGRATGMDSLSPSSQKPPYTDAAEIDDWALPMVSLLSERGYITDSPLDFRPREYITRAETVTLLNNLIGRLWRESGLYNRNTLGNALVAGENTLLLNCLINGDLLIAGGSAQTVILQNTRVTGNIINKSNAELIFAGSGLPAPGNIFYGSAVLPLLPDVPVNPYAGGDFAAGARGRLVYTGSLGGSIAGIDVSEYQGSIDWPAVKADGFDFAIIRVGWRGSTKGLVTVDSRFGEHIRGALDAGLQVGVYFYSQAITPAEAAMEARMTLDLIAPYDITYPVVYDWESPGAADARTKDLDMATLTDCAVTFAQAVQDAGYRPMIYYNSDLAYLRYDLSRLTAYDGWYAGYNTAPEFYYGFRIWQYTSSGSVSGIEGRVDLNICFQPY